MHEIMDEIMYYIMTYIPFLGALTVIPITIGNTVNLFSSKPKSQRGLMLYTIIVGTISYIDIFPLIGTAGDYNRAIHYDQLHNTIDLSHFISILLPCLLGVIGLYILTSRAIEKIPPIISAVSISFVIIGNIIQIMYAIQLCKNIIIISPFHVFHYNVLAISITAIKNHAKQQLALMKNKQFTFKRKWVGKVYNWVDSLSKMSIFIFATLIVVVAILEIILILFGQGVDGPIKAFTMTADWTFSTQIPPPSIESPSGHYLCTVAAGGHEKVVKPLRYGKRRGDIIVVNRQLEVANAFEELIQEKTPNFHKKIRHFYDTYGYPLSNKITTKTRADIVYILMKPLEWLFVLFLYTFDANPEQRIERQYSL